MRADPDSLHTNVRRITVVLVSVAGLGLLSSSVRHTPASAQDDESLIAYAMVDQWPERRDASAGLFQSPIDLEVAEDGTVFVADKGVGGVHRLLPSGVFTTPFGISGGFPAQLGQVGQMALGPDPDGSGELAYVIDSSADRLVVYDISGSYRHHWADISAQSVAASADGRVYVLDTEENAVRALDATDGSELFRFGERGAEDGQFSNFNDVDVTEDGRVLAVADLNTLRVQLFDLATEADIATGTEAMALRDVHNLTGGRYSDNAGMVCRASRVNALGGDRILVGEGKTACLIEGRDVTAAIATTANRGTICRVTVRLPRLRPGGGQFFALATYDPNAGPCDNKRGDLNTSTVVVRYNDERLRSVRTVWEASSEDDVADRLFAPQELSIPANGQVFVRDNSPYLRFYAADGGLLDSISRDTSAKDLGTDWEVTFISRAVGSETLGEVYAQYAIYRKGKTGFSGERGIGRFRATEKATQQGPQDIIEPVWTKAYASGGKDGTSTETINIDSMAWDFSSNELLVLQERVVEQQRQYTLRIVRFSPDGRELDPPIDLPHDGDYNPFSDMAVGPDGRVYLLDDLHDIALILDADGTLLNMVAVAKDARGLAGGPPSVEGSVFVLREHGAIERLADDGTVTARLDGRALPFSDPTYITDLVVDGDGKVYVADGQASLISVFEPTDDVHVLPVPEDGDCEFLGQKTAAPRVVQLGEAVTIDLILSGICGVSEAPTDIIVVVPYPGRLNKGKDTSRWVVDNLLDLGRRVNFDRHRLGIVGYYQINSVEQELTADRDTYIDAVLNLTRYDPPGKIAASLKKAMETADAVFEPEAGRRQVMVLLSALYCDPNNQRKAADCTGWDNADETAKAIRGSGTQIIVTFGDTAANLASSDEDVVNDFEEAHRRIVDYRLPDLTASGITVIDEVPSNMRVIESSIGAGGGWSAPNVTWQRAEMHFDPVTVTFAVEPLEPGIWPTNVHAYADLTDGWGRTQRVAFPVPDVEVIAPTPEPGAPTATPTSTATPRPSIPGTVYLPWLSRNHCWPKHSALDLVLVLDTSNSMYGDKLDAASAAIQSFLDLMRLAPDRDRAALVTFDIDARTLQGLTNDSAALTAALARIEVQGGTRIDLGLREAIGILDVGKRPTAVAVPAIILLSDGRHHEDVDATRAAGAEARERGYDVYTVGLGVDVDAALLAELATKPDMYLEAPTEDDLSEIYAEIAGRLVGCP